MSFEILRVDSKKEWKDFIDLPWLIYDPKSAWVPPLKIAVKETLDQKKNPFYRHADFQAWLAYRDGGPVGRIAAIVDRKHNDFHKEKTGFFGFFESINDSEVAHALFDQAAAWLREKGMETFRGPVNLSTNHECGLLVDGYENQPSVMMTYNPPYYSELFESWGMKKAKDLLAFEVEDSRKPGKRIYEHAERLKKKAGLTFRHLDLSRFEQEVATTLEIYNDAWEQNWGFVPMSPEEYWHAAKDMKSIVDPRLVLFAEIKGDPAGFALAIPDINQVLKKIPSGKLMPTGLIKLLWYLKGPGRKSIDRVRIVTLGIKKRYRDLGLGPLFYAEYFKRGPNIGYHRGECSWILEDNVPMVRACEAMNGRRTKTYRIYDRPLLN